MAMSAGGYFFKALLVLPAKLGHPLGRTLLEFGMILILPGSGGGFQSLELA
jgi:hypothetical protein